MIIEQHNRPLAKKLAQQFLQLEATLVIVDDDPTGTQTVQNVPVLGHWSVESFDAEFRKKTPVFFVLANTRSLPLQLALERVSVIGTNLKEASKKTGRHFLLVSRSDSTLRGHFPDEIQTLSHAAGLSNSAMLFIPAFFEGNRITKDDVHYIKENDDWVPVAETPFAKDKSFGFTQSNLLKWIEEKSAGQIKAEKIFSLTRNTIHQGEQQVEEKLLTLSENDIMIVNSISYAELEAVCSALHACLQRGKSFVFRTAASFIGCFTGIVSLPIQLEIPITTHGGLVVVGSYVPKTSMQLDMLIKSYPLATFEIPVDRIVSIQDDDETLKRQVSAVVESIIASGNDVIVYTSRTLISADDPSASLAIGKKINDFVVDIVSLLTIAPKFIVAKGGITSNDIAVRALNMKRAMVLGQIIPGVPIWALGNESRFPGIPYVVFPGNVGENRSLVEVYEFLSGKIQSL